MTGKMYYESNQSHFIGELYAANAWPKQGTMIWSDGMVYDGDFTNGVMSGTGVMLNDATIYTGSQFSGGSISSSNLTAPEIIDVTYSEGFGLDITLAQDSSNDPGLFAFLDKFKFTGTANGVESVLSVSPSAITMTMSEAQTMVSNGSSIYNAVTLETASSSIPGIENYSEISVFYDLDNDGIGNTGDLVGTVILKDFSKPADIITDFNVGVDKIEVKGSTPESIEWVASSLNATDTIVKIAGTESELFLLDNVVSTTLTSSDFTFV
jgi:hypothetical protein